jgi:hypothetical protein
MIPGIDIASHSISPNCAVVDVGSSFALVTTNLVGLGDEADYFVIQIGPLLRLGDPVNTALPLCSVLPILRQTRVQREIGIHEGLAFLWGKSPEKPIVIQKVRIVLGKNKLQVLYRLFNFGSKIMNIILEGSMSIYIVEEDLDILAALELFS